MKVRELIRLVETDGWFLVRTTGSHRQFHHAVKPGTVTIAGKPAAEVPSKTLASVLRQAQIRRGE